MVAWDAQGCRLSPDPMALTGYLPGSHAPFHLQANLGSCAGISFFLFFTWASRVLPSLPHPPICVTSDPTLPMRLSLDSCSLSRG